MRQTCRISCHVVGASGAIATQVPIPPHETTHRRYLGRRYCFVPLHRSLTPTGTNGLRWSRSSRKAVLLQSLGGGVGSRSRANILIVRGRPHFTQISAGAL